MQSPARRKTALILVVSIACAFSMGIFHLLTMRFDAGDIYPVYSSLRPDPLGTMALFEGLESIEGVAAHRNLKPLEMMPRPGMATIFHLGFSADRINGMEEQEVRALSILAMEGGRIVFALRPERAAMNKGCEDTPGSREDGASEDPAKEGEGSVGKEHSKAAEEEHAVNKRSSLSFYESFRIHIGVINAGDVDIGADNFPMAQGVNTEGALPSLLQWHSAAYIDEVGQMWESVYALDGRPVAMQRTLGMGSVVVITDAYHVTNEALLKSREPGLLAWLLGPNSKVIFEESHLGLGEQPGVAALGRKYHLHWFALALLFLAVMFVWQNATSLVPQGEATTDEGIVMSGKDYASGMVSLMRRNVAPSQLVHICIEEWKRSFLRKGTDRESDVARIDSLIREIGRADTVELYVKIDNILNERKRI